VEKPCIWKGGKGYSKKEALDLRKRVSVTLLWSKRELGGGLALKQCRGGKNATERGGGDQHEVNVWGDTIKTFKRV